MALSCLVSFLIVTFLASTDYSKNFLCLQVKFTKRMIFGVTNIYEVSSFSIDMTEPLGIMELNFTIGSIYQSNTAISDCSNALHGLFIDNDETIVR